MYAARTALYRVAAPVGLPTTQAMAMLNLEPTKGVRSHYRIRTKADGKFLVFGTCARLLSCVN